jgi:hypothetical protein
VEDRRNGAGDQSCQQRSFEDLAERPGVHRFSGKSAVISQCLLPTPYY